MMNIDSLASKIEENVKNSCNFEVIEQNKCFYKAIAKAIIDEITQNAEVTGTDSQGGDIQGKVE
jgi:SLT domain-containing protein